MKSRVQVLNVVCAGALVFGLAACASTADSSNAGSDGGGKKVTSAEFGPDWPLTVDSGTLMCDGSGGVGDAYIVVNGENYALNGLAKGSGNYKDIRPIWADDKALGQGLKKDIGPLIDAALELCK